eukprot:CAMPEP_0182613818 /NCGR_PEP_ID=MMETSP1330-20130603/27429_1 /TAXON_ID=464278 /ORGANISM="Picochlorum sp., Strain RCC944" /LENGTH=52 /DNA_ID=CAMNT_0024833579 /DNA_START=33 /DNA_END=187 /DNA_ORIENTATION=-
MRCSTSAAVACEFIFSIIVSAANVASSIVSLYSKHANTSSNRSMSVGSTALP